MGSIIPRECFQSNNCGTCPVNEYLAAHPGTSDEQREGMALIASRATFPPAELSEAEVRNFIEPNLPDFGLSAAAVAASIHSGMRHREGNTHQGRPQLAN